MFLGRQWRQGAIVFHRYRDGISFEMSANIHTLTRLSAREHFVVVFMEPKGLLSCSRQTATRPYPDPDKLNPSHHADSKNYFNITLTSTPKFSKWYPCKPKPCKYSPVPSSPERHLLGPFLYH
jgi:hypothetical protein